MGRKPLPTALKIVRGNPGRYPLNENEPRPPRHLPDPPEHLHDLAKAEWGRVADVLFNLSLLTPVDRAVLAAYCQSYARWVLAERALEESAMPENFAGMIETTSNGNRVQAALVGIANTAMRDMTKYASEFGMTPSARTRIDAGGPTREAPRANDGEADEFFRTA